MAEGLDLQTRGFYPKAIVKYQEAKRGFFSCKTRPSTLLSASLQGMLLINLGYCYIEKDDFQEGLEYLHEGDQMLPPGHSCEHARYQLFLGTYYGIAGWYKEQLEKYEFALQLSKELLGNYHLFTAICQEHLGYVYANLGNYDRSESFHWRALEIRLSYFAYDDPVIGKSLNNLGFIYRKKGDYDLALYFSLTAKDCFEYAAINHHLQFRICFNLGNLYRDKGDLTRAWEYHEQAAELRKKHYGTRHRHYASSLLNLGRCALEAGRYKETRLYIEKALRIRKNIFPQDHRHLARCKHDLSKVYSQLGYYQEALWLNRKALEIDNKIYKDLPNRAILEDYNLHTFLKMHLEGYCFEQALRKLKQARIQHTVPYLDIWAESFLIEGLIYRELKQWKEAEAAFMESLKFLKKLFQDSRHPKFGRLFLEIGRNFFEKGEANEALSYIQKALISLCHHFNSTKWTDTPDLKSCHKSQNKNVLLEVLQLKAVYLASIGEWTPSHRSMLKEAFYTFRISEKLLNHLLQTVEANEIRQQLILRERQVVEKAVEALIGLFQSEHKEKYLFWALKIIAQHKTTNWNKNTTQIEENGKVAVLNIKNVQRKLKKEDFLIEYLVGQERIYIFTVTKKKAGVITVSLGEQGIQGFSLLCDQFCQEIDRLSSKALNKTDVLFSDDFLQSQAQLYKYLIQPIENRLPHSGSNLILVLDQPLYDIPFSILTDPQKIYKKETEISRVPFLLRRYRLLFTFSNWAWWSAIQRSSVWTGLCGPLVIVEPNQFNSKSTLTKLMESPVFRLHMRYLSEAVHLFGQKASSSRVLAEIQKSRYGLFYGHGDTDKVGRAALSLYGKEKVTVADLRTVTTPADLVVLTNCRQGGVDLIKTFLDIGAGNVLSSLTQHVNEAVARKLVEEMAKKTIQGKSFAEALRKATLQLVDGEGLTVKKDRIHPLAFFCFALYGGWYRE